jgi:hypothetical protein
MYRKKKSMFGFGENSCIKPTKGGGEKKDCDGCPMRDLKGKKVRVIVAIPVDTTPRGKNGKPIGRG